MPPSDAVWRQAETLPDRPTAADLDRLRATDPSLTAAEWHHVVDVTLLRRRARAKFGGDAAVLDLTAAGLEQASRPAVAARRGRLLSESGATSVVDLGCGVGIDAIAAARAGMAVTAVEQDPATARAAAHNLAALAPTGRFEVVCGDATSFPVPPSAIAFVDPGRRAGFRADGSPRRTLAPEQWHPPWSWLQGLAVGHPATVAKVAPGIDRDLPGPDVAVEWVSVAGDLVEATLWFPGVRGARARRTATLLTPGSDPWSVAAERCLSGAGEPAATVAVGAWLLEPDPAVIRAGLVGDLAGRWRAGVLSPGIAYLTGSGPEPTGWGRVSRVQEVLPARPRALRAELRRLGVRPVEIRTRGLGLDPQRLRRELGPAGEGRPAGLVVTRIAGRGAALLVTDPAVPGQ